MTEYDDTLTDNAKHAVINVLREPVIAAALYAEAQEWAEENIDEHEFADFMADCRWALGRLI